MKINIEAFWDEVRAGNIRYQGRGGLYIWNYTQACSYGRHWNENTLLARGLITDIEGNVHARSFAKFFNLNELPGPSLSELPDETPVITRKEDGFLGISYWNPTTNTVDVASRGSFTSEFATYATDWLHKNNPMVTKDVTEQTKYSYVFEILYPHRRIVVDNSNRFGLVLLAAFDNETGEEMSREELELRGLMYRWPVVEAFGDLRSFTKTKQPLPVEWWVNLANDQDGTKMEGFVFSYPKAGVRVKIKGDDYCRIHRAVCSLSKRRIWELVQETEPEQKFADLLIILPTEYKAVAVTWRQELIDEKNIILDSITLARLEVAEYCIRSSQDGSYSRRSIVELLQQKFPKVFHETLAFIDGKPEKFNSMLWAKIKPKHVLPVFEEGRNE